MKSNIPLIKSLSILTLIGMVLLYLVGVYLSYPNQVSLLKPSTSITLQSVQFPSKSGTILHGWYSRGEANKGGILLMHGIRSNRLQMLNRATFLNKAGYSVLLFDFQGHGESIGEKITFGHLEALDAEAGYNYLKEKMGTRKVGVIGVSLGGAAALLGNVKNMADALILESVYPSIEQATTNRLEIKIGSLGIHLLPILMLQLKIQLGIDPIRLQPLAHIAQTKCAIFIMGGDKDLRTTATETKELYHNASKPKKLWILQGASHINFDTYKPKRYAQEVLDFFEKYL